MASTRIRRLGEGSPGPSSLLSQPITSPIAEKIPSTSRRSSASVFVAISELVEEQQLQPGALGRGMQRPQKVVVALARELVGFLWAALYLIPETQPQPQAA